MSSGSLGRAASVMAAGTAVSRALGIVRAAVLAAAIGVNAAGASAFGVANWLPNMLYMLIAGGVLNAVLVPQVVRAYAENEGKGSQYVDRLLSVALALLAGATILLTAAAPLLVRLAAGSGDPDFIALATAFALWCIPQVFFYGLYTLLGQVLNARGSFGPYMWAPVVNNIVSIIGFAVFIAVFGSYAVDGPLADAAAWGAKPIALLGGTATVGIVAQALVLVIPLRRIGFRFRLRWDWRGAGLGTAGRVAGWTFAALLVGQIGVLVVTRVSVSAGLASGDAPDVANNAAYTSAFMIFMLPHSLVTVSLLTALFTRLSAHAADGDRQAMRHDVSTGLRSIALFTLVATVVLSVLALPIVRIVLPTLKPEVAGSLAPVIVALTMGLAPLGVWSLAQRVHYAHEDARTLFHIQVGMALTVVIGSVLGRIFLPVGWWTAAAGAAIAASYLLGAIWGSWGTRRWIGPTFGSDAGLYVRATIAALVSAAIGWPILRLFGDPSTLSFSIAAIACGVVGTSMLAAYLGALRLLGVHDLGELAEPLVARVRRTMRLPARRGARQTGVQVKSQIGQGTLAAGRYRLDHPITCDTPSSQCWAARDQILNRSVRAILIEGERAKRAQDAARRAALVTDPRLLRVLDVGDHEGLAYVITEPLSGRGLDELTANGPLPADQVRAIIGEAAVALEVARRRGLHHLALRPSALHVSGDGQVIVSGLALEGELGDVQARGASESSRADAVGLVQLLYLALTGSWPGDPKVLSRPIAAAPVVAGRPVSPAEIAAGVPADLDTLCAVTLGQRDDGPHSPAELIRELEPWGEVSLTVAELRSEPLSAFTQVTQAELDPDSDFETDRDTPESDGATFDVVVDPTDFDPEELDPAEFDPAPIVHPSTGAIDLATAASTVASGAVSAEIDEGVITSVPRTGDQPAKADDGPDAPEQTPNEPERDPGDTHEIDISAYPSHVVVPPPPLPHPPVRSSDPLTSAMPGPARTTPPVGAPSAPAQDPGVPHSSAHQPGFDDMLGRPADLLVRRRFDPTSLVLGLVAVGVVLGLVFALRTLTSPPPPIGGSGGVDLVQTAAPAEGETDSTDSSASAEPNEGEPQATAPETAVPPSITSAQQIDPPPGGDDNEHPELVSDAIDNDPSTMWLSRTYNSPTYGMKSGIGFAVNLAEPTMVSSVTLLTAATGGMVEIRATSPDTPTEGEVLASGPLSSPTTEFTFAEPVEASSIVLWWTTLPQNPEGKNRIELQEISVH